MTVSNDPKIIRDPVPINGSYRIDVDVFADRLLTTRQNLTGKTVTSWVKDPGGAWHEETVTVDTATTGDAHVTLTAVNYDTAGTAELRIYVDGEPNYPFYQFEFVEEAA